MPRSATDVERLVHQGEDLTLEFKSDVPRIDILSRVIAAFANSEGGTVILGVDEKGRIVGVDPNRATEATRWAVERLDPRPQTEVGTVRIASGSVVTIDVYPADTVTFAPEGVYVRASGSVVPASPDDVRRRARHGGAANEQVTLDRFAEMVAKQTLSIEKQANEIRELTKRLTRQSEQMGRLERGSHWSRQLFWCLLGVVLGAIAGALVATLLG